MNSDLNFNSQFSDYFHNFILEKRGLGCKYETEAAALRLFDRYVCKSGYGQYILGKPANGLGNRAIYQPAAS